MIILKILEVPKECRHIKDSEEVITKTREN